jgi:TolA-binding protein
LNMLKKLPLIIVILAPLCAYGFSQERELYSQAQSRYLSNNYTAAFETFDEIVRLYPLSDLVPDAQYWKAVCLFRLGMLDDSLELFEVVERRYRATRFIDLVPFWKGVALFQKKAYEEARDQLIHFFEEGGDPELIDEALLYRAMAEVYLELFEEARLTMEQLRNRKGDSRMSPYEAVLYSYILLNLDRHEEFLAFTGGIEIDRFPPEWREKIILFRAEAHFKFGHIQEAEIDYTKLIDADVETSAVALRRLYYIASLRQDFSRMEWVVQHAEERLRTYPELLQEFWMRIGIESYRRGEYDLAAYFLSKVWNLNVTGSVPEAVPLYLAQIYLKQGRREDALRVMEEYVSAMEEEEQAALSSFSLGNIYLHEGRYEDASEQYARTVTASPEGALAQNARYFLAYTSYKQELLQDALVQCDEFLQIATREETRRKMATDYDVLDEAMQLKVRILRDQGREEEAAKLLEDYDRGKAAVDSELVGNVVRLKSRVLQALGRTEDAGALLKTYASRYPAQVRLQVDLARLHFTTGEFAAVVEETGRVLAERSLLASEDLYAYVILSYMRGLSEIALKGYKNADETLAGIDAKSAENAGLAAIVPHLVYYRAWARYRMNDLDASIAFTDTFMTEHRGHPLYPRALYLGAWCRYSKGAYAEAAMLFSQLAAMEAGDLSNKAMFLLGQCQKNLSRLEEASSTFSAIYSGHPASPFADDALFEHADILRKQGRSRRAAEQYYRVWQSYPSSPLAQEALYLRGELFFDASQYEDAQSAFREYRLRFPDGRLVDASLYWEGVSSQRLGEDRVAVVLWEEVITAHPSSTFRPDAMRGAAESYVTFGEYSRAYNLYSDLTREYPEYSKNVRAEIRMEEIRYLRFGLGEREAELAARISRAGGAETPEGREAMIELARLYIFEQEDKLERAYQILNQVMQKKEPNTAAEAGILLGEYYYRQGDRERAAREFFQASLKNPEDHDLMAYAIYRAAQTMKETGNLRETRELVKRLRDNFPLSSWADEGAKLLEGIDE